PVIVKPLNTTARASRSTVGGSPSRKGGKFAEAFEEPRDGRKSSRPHSQIHGRRGVRSRQESEVRQVRRDGGPRRPLGGEPQARGPNGPWRVGPPARHGSNRARPRVRQR